ncbi:MAG TPA: hypothetical protein VFP50_08605 [Anaeromyxobacteraceae bacterium]|nr:hypothetical protein [Anaeromyxobacteraceae bacterium]
MTRWLAVGTAALLAGCMNPDRAAQPAPAARADGDGAPAADGFELVGHDPLFGRGMNAAIAIFDHFVYVGNRSDGSSSCGDLNGNGPVAPVLTPTNADGTCTHVHPGILIVDVEAPERPAVVGEIPAEVAAPSAAGKAEGVTSRELRVWPEKKLLVELSFRCSRLIHACPRGNDTTFPFDFKFFDLSDPVHPRLLARHVTTSRAGVAVKPHEFYLWVDPRNEDRALLFESTPTASVNPARPNLVVEDISAVPDGGDVTLVAQGNWNQLFPGAADPAAYDFDLALHSMTPTPDGKTTYLAYLRGGMLVLDTSDVASGASPGTVISLDDKLLTPIASRPVWGNGNHCLFGTVLGCSESHSAVPVPGRALEISIDEVYGTFTDPSFGWPWGWLRIIDVADPTHPRIASEYRLPQNTEAFRPQVDPETEQFTSYSTHNPNVLRNLVLDSWHSAGLQAVDIADPANPTPAASFVPAPLASVALEDPALSRGPNKVVVWSFPIIKDGLVYVVDIRNGLYVLRYTGPHREEVERIEFLEANSNLGDALELFEEGARGR